MLAKKWLGQVVLSLVLGSVLVGCNKPSVTNSDGKTDTTQPAVIQKTNDNVAGEITAKALSEQVMSTMASAFLAANQMAKSTQGKEKFTQEQISCFTTTANDKLEKNLQQHLAKIFNADEIKQMDDYYASEVGKKQIAMIRDLMNGADQTIQPTEDEQEQMQTFWQSETGQKLANALQDRNALAEPLTEVITEKETVCQMPKP